MPREPRGDFHQNKAWEGLTQEPVKELMKVLSWDSLESDLHLLLCPK